MGLYALIINMENILKTNTVMLEDILVRVNVNL